MSGSFRLRQSCHRGPTNLYYVSTRDESIDVSLTRRLGAPRNTEEKEETGDKLDCERNDPLSFSLDVNGPIAGVIDPEA